MFGPFDHTYAGKQLRGKRGDSSRKPCKLLPVLRKSSIKTSRERGVITRERYWGEKGWFRVMQERVTLLHRTHIFAALYCITCVVCNYDNVCLIACLQPQLIPCRQHDAVTPSQSSFVLSYVGSVMLYSTEDYFELVSRVCGPSVSHANERCTDTKSDVDITLLESR